MKAKLVKSCDADNQGIPLDLESLLSPYRHHKQLSIRIEQLPQLARLSKGRNNGDCTFSLKPDELPSLVYLPPAGSDGSPVTLAVRIVNLDDDYATTLALIDLPVPPKAVSVASTKRQLRVVETPGEIPGEAGDQPAEPAALQAIHVKRPDETGTEIDPARAAVQTELEDKLSRLRERGRFP